MRPIFLAKLCSPIAVAVVVLHQLAATAQPTQSSPPLGPPKLASGLPVESVTVLGVKPSDAVIKSFVEARAIPTRVLDKLPRWISKICPHTTGLKDTYANYITQRIRDVATAVGAPVNTYHGCRPNLEVAFTTTPQQLMDNVKAKEPYYLGFYDNSSDADQLARVTRPIQAWYTTASEDIDGDQQIDEGTCNTGNLNVGARIQSHVTNTVNEVVAPCAKYMRASGFRVGDDLTSGLYHVLIVAEPAKLADYEIGSLADYIAMLALSQPASLDTCQELPSISNMLAPGCASVPTHITDGDLAYLRALYKMPDGSLLAVQLDEMRFQMKKTLVTDKGGAN